MSGLPVRTKPLCVVSSILADEKHDHHELSETQLGALHFPVTCSPSVQKRFERGVALLHSFAFETAETAMCIVLAGTGLLNATASATLTLRTQGTNQPVINVENKIDLPMFDQIRDAALPWMEFDLHLVVPVGILATQANSS
jgi:hypothetical protein